MASLKYDAIIIGGGHNGLICAAYLAKAGRKVLVLEKRHVLGGAAVSEELYPGFTFSSCSYVVSLFRPQIIRDLELAKHGMEIIPLETSFTPRVGDPGLCRWPDYARSRKELSRFSAKDAEIYPEFSLTMTKMAQFARNIIDSPAPDPTSWNPRELMRLVKLGNDLRRSGVDAMNMNLKLMTMSAVDFLDMWFESDVLKAPMAVSGIIGTYLGVRSPGTAYVLLHHYMGEIDGAFRSWGLSKGGTGGVSMACARAAESFGAEIRTEAGVQEVMLKGGKATGVVLENGDTLPATTVISCCDPRKTFMGLIGEQHLDDEFASQIRRYKLRGSSGKVNLAVDRLPEFFGRQGTAHLRGDIAIAPGIDYLEKAYDEAKYGDFSKRPYINVVIPSLLDPSVAPPGKHIISMFVQYAPYHIREGAENWPSRREAFGDAVVDTFAEYCPGLKDSILYRHVLTPWDLEQEYGLTEGNIFQGELTLEQLLFQRPAAGWSHYKTPIKNFWMCGSGTHPGGGIMGASGQLAAKTLLGSGEL
jgi:phytoene dehydrogenase-like protein